MATGIGTPSRAGAVSVSTTPTQIIGRSSSGDTSAARRVRIIDDSGGQTVYLGPGSDVDTTDGFPLATGEVIDLELYYYDEVWGVVTASTQVVHYYELHGNGGQ